MNLLVEIEGYKDGGNYSRLVHMNISCYKWEKWHAMTMVSCILFLSIFVYVSNFSFLV
jgi:hypothetical protein